MEINLKNKAELVTPPGLIIFGFRGSVAHGMYIPGTDPDSIDDIDLMGVFINPKEHYLGFSRKEDFERFEGQYDVVCYELRKFISLLMKCNPNVMSLLYLEKDHMEYTTPLGQRLIDNRDLFASKIAYNSFCGYAHSQLSRMEKSTYKGYMGSKRKELVDRYGYDCKHAAHLIRLLKMGTEFLQFGKLYVNREDRGDADELLGVKRGKYKLKAIQEWADELFLQINNANRFSNLPDKPDKEKIEKLLIEILEEHFYEINK
tara:strand:- start:19733 stop:20512 length:780 start_codon:yes stop_codon:yes gene_type:complete